MYDVSPDGKRFLMIKQDVSSNEPAALIVVVQKSPVYWIPNRRSANAVDWADTWLNQRL